MFRLGVGYPDRHNYPLHHPLFEINEEAIVTGVVTMAYSAYKYFYPQ
jgi:metal-dependent amidase/aminoacylase/carboxypeptidase family protein